MMKVNGMFQPRAMLTLMLVLACDGDTLYETGPGDVPPPQVSIARPVGGTDAQAGRPLRVQVEATDSLGISVLSLVWAGAASGLIEYEFVPARAAVAVDTVISVPAGASGRLDLRASARNGRGAVGRSASVALNVMDRDTVIPGVGIEVIAPLRAELTDSIRVRVTAGDRDGGSGLVRVGFTALVTRPMRPDTLIYEQFATVEPAAAGTVVREFRFPPPFADERALPDQLTFEFHGWAVDASSNCAAGVAAEEQRLACVMLQRGGQQHTLAAGVPVRHPVVVVAGRSVGLAEGSTIADAVPDVQRQRLYLSNLGRNRVEVLDLALRGFRAPVTVGSGPWGLGLNRSGDTLIVANSGGTNLSFVTLAGTPAEVVSSRVRTPNAVLFTVERQFDTHGRERLQVRFFDFSDRPQFVAQDAFGRLLYSTLPTPAAPDGTMRVAENSAGWEQPEVRLMLGRGIFEADSTNTSILHVDSMRVFSDPTGSDRIEIYDHREGFPSQIIRSGIRPLDEAIDALDGNPDSDIVWAPGRFVMDLLGLRDTTFVAASGDRMRIAFGEGSRDNGRVFMWNAATRALSNEITVADLVGNSAEHILGLDLNIDGSLGAARGENAAYFFKEDLRLQGHFTAPVSTGSGAVVHPQHPSYLTFPPSSASTLAFVAEGTSVRIVDTVHFTERGRIELRDTITGPLRVSGPLANDNPAGCTGQDCIIAKLYAVTAGNSVVIVDVRSRDVR